MSITELFVRRPTLVTVFLALVLIAGIVSGTHLIAQRYPSGDIPTIQVLVTYSGASTTEMRDAIVRPLEDQLAGAPDLGDLETAIEPGQATLIARYSLGSDVNTDLVQTQSRVQNAERQLPSDVQAPTISIYDPSQAVVVSLAVSSHTMNPGALSSLVSNRIVPSLEQVEGVSYVEINGAVKPAIAVTVHPQTLNASGETLTDVVTAISQNNVRAPGGIVYGPDRETNVDIRGDISQASDVSGLVVGSASASTGTNAFSTSARLLSIGDIASVAEGYEPQRVYAYEHGSPMIQLDVQKASNHSEIDASNAVLAQLPKLRVAYPSVAFDVISVEATATKAELTGVFIALLEAIALTAVVMVFFLRSWRNALVVMVAIPTSLLVTLAAMKLANFTLDTVSLLAMTLVIGILVDDSIVVLENVERHAEDGEEPEIAAVRGRLEIGAAAVVITLVDVVVFLPLSFLPGTVGVFLREFGLVVTVATVTSLLVSFTITPALAGRWSLKAKGRPWKIIDAFTTGFEHVRDVYVDRALPFALRAPVVVIAVSFLSLIGALALLPLGVVGVEYIPATDRGELYITVNYPEGTPLETTRKSVLALESHIDGLRSLQSETAIAGAYQGNLSGYITNGAIGQIHLYLASSSVRTMHIGPWTWTMSQSIHRPSTATVAANIQSMAQQVLPQATISVVPATSADGGVAQPIDEVVTSDSGDPATAADAVYRTLAATPGATGVTTSGGRLGPQVEVRFQRESARALDASVGTASTAIRAAFGGDIATQFVGQNGLEDVQVIYPYSARESLDGVRAIPIRGSGGSLLHVGDIASLALAPAPPLITRIDRRSVVYLGANTAPGAELSNVQRAFTSRLARLDLPSSITVAPAAGGNQNSVTQTVTGMSISLVLSIVLVYLLMVGLYNSYRVPFVIMFSVPVAVVGALGGLAIMHQTLNLFSFIGSILLVGLVTKNGILLVDFADRLSDEGMSRREAVIASARTRFRPIVMTTFAMIAGMSALVLDPNAADEQSLGIVVIGGLLSSLVLTLLLVPTIALRIAPRPRKNVPLPAAPTVT